MSNIYICVCVCVCMRVYVCVRAVVWTNTCSVWCLDCYVWSNMTSNYANSLTVPSICKGYGYTHVISYHVGSRWRAPCRWLLSLFWFPCHVLMLDLSRDFFKLLLQLSTSNTKMQWITNGCYLSISISHRLRKPRNARPHEPAPIIVRFLRRTDRNRVISERKQLKDYNQDRDFKIYVNEDLTTRRAKLFAKMRTLQKKRLLKQAWTYNGNIKVMMPNGEIKNIANISSIQSLLPDVDISAVN